MLGIVFSVSSYLHGVYETFCCRRLNKLAYITSNIIWNYRWKCVQHYVQIICHFQCRWYGTTARVWQRKLNCNRIYYIQSSPIYPLQPFVVLYYLLPSNLLLAKRSKSSVLYISVGLLRHSDMNYAASHSSASGVQTLLTIVVFYCFWTQIPILFSFFFP